MLLLLLHHFEHGLLAGHQLVEETGEDSAVRVGDEGGGTKEREVKPHFEVPPAHSITNKTWKHAPEGEGATLFFRRHSELFLHSLEA